MVAAPERQSTATRNTRLVNVEEVQRALPFFFTSPGQVVEVRALKASREQNTRFTRTLGGFFDNPDDLLKEICTIRVAMGIYITLHPCHPDLLHRAKNKLNEQENGASTSDKDITGLRWLAIDCDPKRVSGVSATDGEHEKALAMCRKIRTMLKALGWPDPIFADSGNGGHLLYRVGADVDASLLKRVLEGMQQFNEPDVHVDTTLFNPSRIIKLYGTLACKGDNTTERPHRLSRIIEVPDIIETVSTSLLEAIAVLVAQNDEKASSTSKTKSTKDTKQKRQKDNEDFDSVAYIENILQDHTIGHKPKQPWDGDGWIWELNQCWSDPSHVDGDAYITVGGDNKIGAGCHHDSCTGKKWESFKDHYGIETGKKAAPSNETVDTTKIDQAIATKDVKAVFQASDILACLTRAEYAIYKQQIKDTFGSDINLRDLDIAVSEQRKIIASLDAAEKPTLDTIADDFVARYKEDWAFNPLTSIWYQWTSSHWQDMQDVESQRKSCVSLDRIVRDLILQRGLGITKTSDLDGIVRLAAIECVRTFKQPSMLVNFKNGTLDLNTNVLRPHDRNDELTYCLPYDYEEHGRWDTICTFLRTLYPDKYARQNFMTHVGLSLMGDTKMHFTCAIIGPPRTGKSTGLDIANLACGIEEKQYSGKTLFDTDLEGKRTRFMQNKKRVVCIDELPAESLRSEENFKNMTAHSGVEMRGMNRDDELNNRWRPKIFMAMNEMPEYKDTTEAMKERLVPLLVGTTLAREDRDIHLTEKMKPEIGGFAASCLRLAQAALTRGFYPLSGAMKKTIEALAMANNPLKSFLEEECILDPNGSIFTADLYKEYKEYCSEAGNIPLGSSKMSSELVQMNKSIKPQSKRNPFNENKVERGLAGIRMRKASDEYSEDAAKRDDPMLFVDDVDGMLTALFFSRQHDEAASEAGSDTHVDDVDGTSEKSAHTGTAHTKFNQDTDTGMNTHICESKNGEVPSTSSTSLVDQPVETAEHVDGTFFQPSTAVNSRQQIGKPVNLIDEMLAIGKRLGYPDVPDLGLGYGMLQWNSFANSRRMMIPDVLARFPEVAM